MVYNGDKIISGGVFKMSEHILYCPKCGDVQLDYFDNKEDRLFGGICVQCSGFFKKYELLDTGKSYEYFNEKAEPIDEFSSNWEEEVRKEFVYNNPLYNEHNVQKRKETEQRCKRKREEEYRRENSYSPSCTEPHCPTCDSTNVEKISMSSKVEKAAKYGILSVDSITKQFECKNCGYKW